jgi:hypothetical protein
MNCSHNGRPSSELPEQMHVRALAGLPHRAGRLVHARIHDAFTRYYTLICV